MKILFCHNYYQQRGGEDQVFEDEARLLESRGHEVIWHTLHSDSINGRNLLNVAFNALWSRQSYQELIATIEKHSPDVIHVVNTFPLFSPSIFFAARRAEVPLVASIHNYRIFCAQAMCYRAGHACEACLGRIPWRAVIHGCYRGSRTGSAVVASMQLLHRFKRTWAEQINVVCVLSEFSKRKLIEAGLSEKQMIIKPNFVGDDPGKKNGSGKYAVFVGRLAGEKGITTLVDVWAGHQMSPMNIPLKIIGDGPENERVRRLQESNSDVQWLGRLTNEDVYRWLGDAACLIFPSTGYESLPKTLIEAMAVGTPVIGSNIGSIPEVVIENQTGHLFPVGNAGALATTVQRFFGTPEKWSNMRDQCRQQFEQRFMKDANYDALIAIYEEAIRRRRKAAVGTRTVTEVDLRLTNNGHQPVDMSSMQS